MTIDTSVRDVPRVNNATPTIERCVSSYPARRGFKPYVQDPPKIEGVRGMIDIHCHAEEGQQDALSVGKLASENGMYGIVYKNIGAKGNRTEGPMEDVRNLVDALARWSDETGIKPIKAWGGSSLTRDNKPPNTEKVRKLIDSGVTVFYMPLSNHANTYSLVGGRPRRWDPNADPKAHSEPLPWDLAVKYGHYALDEKGDLKPEYEEAVRMIIDSDRTLSFGHSTHREIFALAELVDKLNYKRAFIDHPFSPFVDITIEQMRELAKADIHFNFTFDELSPLLGIDPAKMYAAIRSVGVENFTLSSDTGDTLFPNSVEAMRQISGFMIAFGMSAEEIEVMCTRNPAALLGLDPDAVVREINECMAGAA